MASHFGLSFFFSTIAVGIVSINSFTPPTPKNSIRGKPGCRIYLIRHGETANAGDICLNGHFDVALSSNGFEQARNISEALKDKPLDCVYSSDLQRTHEAAKIIAEPHKLEPIAHPELRELSFGKWEGLSLEELDRRYPGEFENRIKNTETFQAEGGETFQDLQDRVLPKFQEILANHPTGSIAILSHGGVNRVILGHILGIPTKYIFRISQEYSAVNIIQYYPDQPTVELINGDWRQIR